MNQKCSATNCIISPYDNNFESYVYIGKQFDIIITPCINLSNLNKISVFFFVDNFCATISKVNKCGDYSVFFTGTNSLPDIKKYLEENKNLTTTKLLKKIDKLKVLILIQDPIKSIYSSIAIIKTTLKTDIIVDATTQETLIFYQNFISSLLNNSPNFITVVFNNLLGQLASVENCDCFIKMIRVMKCFPCGKGIFKLLTNYNIYLEQPIYSFMFYNVNNKFIFNAKCFPGTVFIDQNKTVNLQSNCLPNCPVIYSSDINRFFITNNCSISFLQNYYLNLFGKESKFISSLSEFLCIIDLDKITLSDGSTLSLVINITANGIYYESTSEKFNIGIKILLTILNTYLLFLIQNGGKPETLIEFLNVINGVLNLLSLFANDDCSQTILTYLELFINSIIAFLNYPSIQNLLQTIESLDKLLKNTDIISIYQQYKDFVDTLPISITRISYLKELKNVFLCQDYTDCEKLVIALLYYIKCFGSKSVSNNDTIIYVTGLNKIIANQNIINSSIPNIIGITYDSNTNYLYIVSSSTNYLYIIDGITGISILIYPLQSENLNNQSYTIQHSLGLSGKQNKNNFIIKISVVGTSGSTTKYFISQYTIASDLQITQNSSIYVPSVGQVINQATTSFGILLLLNSYTLLAQTISTSKYQIYLFFLNQLGIPIINLPAPSGQFCANKNLIYFPITSLNEYTVYEISSTYPLEPIETIPLPFSPVAMVFSIVNLQNVLYILDTNGNIYLYDADCNTEITMLKSGLSNSDIPNFIYTDE
jgi:putative component of membrane protein insertase Oxa1/YidC/SpoIIIJ protein YidD